MMQEIKTISLALPFRLGRVNCYLVRSGTGFLLIDTGGANMRAELEKALASAGCQLGNLTLILLTHGDFDHSGNAAYLRGRFGTKIAMQRDDSGMAEYGDMFWNRKKGNVLNSMLTRIAPTLFGFGKAERFKPDFYVDNGDDLSEYGFDAKILCLPGHSKGSIGILTAGGDLFCGDLFENRGKPQLNSIMDDLTAAHASLEMLQGLEINTAYPGHGKPFAMEQLDLTDGC